MISGLRVQGMWKAQGKSQVRETQFKINGHYDIFHHNGVSLATICFNHCDHFITIGHRQQPIV